MHKIHRFFHEREPTSSWEVSNFNFVYISFFFYEERISKKNSIGLQYESVSFVFLFHYNIGIRSM